MTMYATCQSWKCPSRRSCMRNAESGTQPQPGAWVSYADFERDMDFSREARCPDYLAKEPAR